MWSSGPGLPRCETKSSWPWATCHLPEKAFSGQESTGWNGCWGPLRAGAAVLASEATMRASQHVPFEGALGESVRVPPVLSSYAPTSAL